MDYHRVAERMRAITETTMTLQHQYSTTLRPLPRASGRVSVAVFEHALATYENNQVFYQDRIDDGALTKEEITAGLTALEAWFMNILEPVGYDEGRDEREAKKKETGRSGYCDPELYPYVRPRK
jgi:hypothetical protein